MLLVRRPPAGCRWPWTGSRNRPSYWPPARRIVRAVSETLDRGLQCCRLGLDRLGHARQCERIGLQRVATGERWCGPRHDQRVLARQHREDEGCIGKLRHQGSGHNARGGCGAGACGVGRRHREGVGHVGAEGCHQCRGVRRRYRSLRWCLAARLHLAREADGHGRDHRVAGDLISGGVRVPVDEYPESLRNHRLDERGSRDGVGVGPRHSLARPPPAGPALRQGGQARLCPVPAHPPMWPNASIRPLNPPASRGRHPFLSRACTSIDMAEP